MPSVPPQPAILPPANSALVMIAPDDQDTTLSTPTFAPREALDSPTSAIVEYSREALSINQESDILPSPTRTLASTPPSKYAHSLSSPPAYAPPTPLLVDSSEEADTFFPDPAANSLIPVSPEDLIPASILEKFSQKWPVPRCATRTKRSLSDVSSMTAKDGQPQGHLARLGRGLKWARQGHELEDTRWAWYKWILLFSILTLFFYGTASLAAATMTWLRTWRGADVFMVADFPLLVLITLMSVAMVAAAITGIAGIILDSRPVLAVYTLLLWPAFMLLVAVGYVAYKKSTFSLDHKLNLAWSRSYSETGRRLIQDTLQCCGYYSPLHQITASSRCYTRSALPGCKEDLWQFERKQLAHIWRVAFSLVPIHLFNIFLGLICSNHVTSSFGRGLLPVQYRLIQADVKGEAERLLSQDCRLGAVYSLKRNATLKSMKSVKEAAGMNEKHVVFGNQSPNVQ